LNRNIFELNVCRNKKAVNDFFLNVAFGLLLKEFTTALDGRETCCTREMAVGKLQLQLK